MNKCLICGAVFDDERICPVCGADSSNFIFFEPENIDGKEDTKEIFLVLGGGIAGVSAAKAVRDRNSTATVVIVSDEEYFPYNRPMLTKLLGTKINPESLMIKPQKWYDDNSIYFMGGKEVVSIDSNSREVELKTGEKLYYDKLIYALGAKSFIPPFKGVEKSGVFSIRNIVDVNKINAKLKQGIKVAIIGGGVLGLEAAWALKQYGAKVTIIEAGSKLMGRQLDDETAELLKQRAQSEGISVCIGKSIEEITGLEEVSGIKLSDREIDAELVIISCGVRSNISVLQNAGAMSGRAVKTDEYMRTNLFNVYACGDCAEFDGINYSIWPQAETMGNTAGTNAARGMSKFKNYAAALTFIGFGTKLVSMGKTEGQSITKNKENGFIKEFYEGDKLCGCILFGDISSMRDYQKILG